MINTDGVVVTDAVLETKDIAKDLYTSARGDLSKLYAYILQFWNGNSPVQRQADFFPSCVFFFILLSGEFWRILPPGGHLVKAVSKDKRLQSTEFDVKVSLLQFMSSSIYIILWRKDFIHNFVRLIV